MLWLEAIFYTSTQHLSASCCPSRTDPPPLLLISTLARARWSDGKRSASSRARHTGGREPTQAPSQSSSGSRFLQCCVQTGTTKEECKWGHYSLFRAGTSPSPPPPLGEACRRNRENIWWEQGNPGGVEPWQSRFFPSAEGPAGSALLGPQNSWAFHFLPNKALEFFLCLYHGCWYTIYNPTPPPKSRLAALFSGIAKVLCLRPSSRKEAGEGAWGERGMISLLGQRLTSKF